MPEDIPALLARAAAAFSRWAGRPPTHAAAAPGRVNLIGEHVDYNGGHVLPLAIDRWCVAVAAPALPGADPVSRAGRILSTDMGQEAPYDLARAEPAALAHRPWARYPAGVLWAVRRAYFDHPLPALDVALASSVPLGAGLSSSAALEMAVATVASAAWGLNLRPLERATLAQAAERDSAGVPCGLMDQLASARGVAGSALLIDCESSAVTPVPLPAAARVVVLNTGVRHALAAGEYADRRRLCEEAAAALGVSNLRRCDPDHLLAHRRELSDDQWRCAKHVVAECARVLRCAEALRAGDLRAAGALMNGSHASLRDDFRVSCPELDHVAAAAQSAPGVHGCRMTGAGFGGCCVALCDASALPRLRAELPAPYRARFGLDLTIDEVHPVAGAHVLLP